MSLEVSSRRLRVVLSRDQGLIDLVDNSGGHVAQAALFAKARQSVAQFGRDTLGLFASHIFIPQFDPIGTLPRPRRGSTVSPVRGKHALSRLVRLVLLKLASSKGC